MASQLDGSAHLRYGARMGKREPDTDQGLTPKERAAKEREERLRKQLRANLQRRKAQARSRATPNDKTPDQD